MPVSTTALTKKENHKEVWRNLNLFYFNEIIENEIDVEDVVREITSRYVSVG